MVTDLRHISGNKGRKVAQNRLKPRKEPLNSAKYLQPLLKGGSRIFMLLVLLGMLAGLVYGFNTIASFPVKKIEVYGASRLTREEIIELTGVKAGQNLLAIDLKVIGQHVSANPWVASARVQRFFPGTIAITIREREPVAVINMGFLCYLDRSGEPFKPLAHGDNLNFPVVTGISEEDLASSPAETRTVLSSTCNLITSLRQHGTFILADVSEIHYDAAHGFTIYTTARSLPVKIGSDNFDVKLQRFARIYQDLMTQKSDLQYIDLDYSDKIVVKKSQA